MYKQTPLIQYSFIDQKPICIISNYLCLAYLHNGDINPMITMTKENYESDDYEYEKNE